VADFTIINDEQRSEGWRLARLGRVTGSCAGQMLASIKSGEAAGRRNLRVRLVLERLTGQSHESDFVSPAMEIGIEREAEAIAVFEAKTGHSLMRTGFLSHNALMAGCSPDAYIGEFDTLVSIKCRQAPAHLEFIRKGTIPSDSWAQMKHELWMTDALEHTYVSYNPEFPDNLQMRFGTFTRDAFEIEEYDKAITLFLTEVDLELSVLKGWVA
jgi:hypothetical protein